MWLSVRSVRWASPGGARLAAVTSTREQLRSLLHPRPGRLARGADKQPRRRKKLKIESDLSQPFVS